MAAEVERPLTGLGTSASADHLTLLLYPGAEPSSLAVYEASGEAFDVALTATGATLSALPRPLILRVRREQAPDAVTLDGAPVTRLDDRAAFDAAVQGWFADADQRTLWVKLPARPEAAATVAWAPPAVKARR